MLVRDVMQRNVITIGPETTLPEAVHLASRRGIRHLPVVEDGKLVGIVSDRDLKRAMASPATSLEAHELNYLLARLRVDAFMTRAVITIAPMFPIEEAGRLMVQEKVGALPVTQDDELLGIVTETDVLQLFVKALGAGEPSSRLDVLLGTRPTALADVVRVLGEVGVTISSIVTLGSPGGLREAVVRINTIRPGPAIEALRAQGYTVRDVDRDRRGVTP